MKDVKIKAVWTCDICGETFKSDDEEDEPYKYAYVYDDTVVCKHHLRHYPKWVRDNIEHIIESIGQGFTSKEILKELKEPKKDVYYYLYINAANARVLRVCYNKDKLNSHIKQYHNNIIPRDPKNPYTIVGVYQNNLSLKPKMNLEIDWIRK